jgi:glyoxylase-like metal-dependent hydrolase (beta-lactamase superfamily II)
VGYPSHTGSRCLSVERTVDALVREWLAEHPHDVYQLIVAHTHAHGDHVAADGQFANRADTIIVAHGVEAVKTFFGIANGPLESGKLALGGRVLEICPSRATTPRRWRCMTLERRFCSRAIPCTPGGFTLTTTGRLSRA